MAEYTKRYSGVRWKIVYGSYDGVEKFAVNELQTVVQRYMPYVLAIESADLADVTSGDHVILLGTAADNRFIAEIIDKGLLTAPEGPEGYSAALFASPWNEGTRVMTIAGSDASGVLYGVEDFDIRIPVTIPPEHPTMMRKAFDEMRDFDFSGRPLVDNRGIWTWGYVIYDYKRFIDNMARCRMNMLTMWNDCPPVNSRDIIDYAHSRRVKVVFGFHWGWGIEHLDPSSEEQRKALKAEVIQNYRENYSHLGLDGIYFQTFTEHTNLSMGDKSTAAYACEWVNDIAAGLFEIDPNLHIQFGLHATSILEQYVDLEPLDPRVTITWEDAGVIPYSYNPVLDLTYAGFSQPGGLGSPEATLEYSKKLVNFRANKEFALVPKGWMTLDWSNEFEHHGPFILGERSPEFIKQRLEQRMPRWDMVNALWVRHYPYAAHFYREILKCGPDKMLATALVEDGLFEEEIQISVALFAETVWNPNRSDEDILQAAMSPHYIRK